LNLTCAAAIKRFHNSGKGLAMHFKQLDANVAVAPQILAEDVPKIAAAGFASIICNRPDGESADQTPYAAIQSAASAAGIPICNVPVVSGAITMDDVRAMKAALEALPKPVFAYCRSGARCTNLYALVQDLDD
jgi:uncharacterized protein (TIGR01244 family)